MEPALMDVALRSLPLRAAAAAAARRPEIFLGGDLSFSPLVGFFLILVGGPQQRFE